MSGSGVVVFDYSLWAAQFPELASSVNSDQAQLYFDLATLTVDNSATSFIVDLTKRANILNTMTSHIAALLAPINGIAPSPLVGRINNASEGSVSVSTEMNAPQAASWFNQTKYGAMAWTFMAPYRTALYIAAPVCWPGNFGRGFPGPFNNGFPWPR